MPHIMYKPTNAEQERRTEAYGYLKKMIDLKKQEKPHFSGPNGARNFLGYIDDSERILNGYTYSRDEQGKEEWQSNIMDNITRAKLRAIAAGIGLNVPEMKYRATNKNGVMSKAHADIMRHTVQHSFNLDNPTKQAFLEVWQLMAHGVLIEYEGYHTGGAKRKVVESFDSRTGEVKTKTEYVEFDGKPVSIILNPQEFFWWDYFQEDVNKQPRVAWLQHYSKMEIEAEFSKYKNYQYIKDKKSVSEHQSEIETTFYRVWSDRVEDEGDYEVFRLYSLEDDTYQVYVNGIEILNVPMLWGGKKKKYYPFAKTIMEPFANPNFFVGVSFPALLEGYQEAKNTTLNTIIDKLYRSLVPPMLVGLQNRDLLDTEDELVNQDNRYYVPDVSQVKPFPYRGVDGGDLQMLEMITHQIDTLSVDANQMGQQGKGVTAREAIIADERARQLKGILFMFLEDLWLQKHKLRGPNILTHYLKDKATRSGFKDQTVTVENAVLPDGSVGILDIHIADSKSKLLNVVDIEAREQAMATQGINYKLISMPSNYLDEWEFDYQVIPESLYNQDRLRKEADVKEKQQGIATLYPEYFVSNKDKFFEEFVDIYGESLDDYEPPAPPTQGGAEQTQGNEQQLSGGSILGLE